MSRFAWAVALACGLVVTFLLGYWPLRLIDTGWWPTVADDAFYYLIVAKNIATTGRSSFDGVVLTNGYHPLWQLVLALQYLICGESILVTTLVQVAAVGSATVLLCRALGPGTMAWWPLVAALFFATSRDMAVTGMETPLLLVAFALFVLALQQGSAIWTGLAASLAIGARLDAALFVIPAILLAPRRDKLVILAVVAGGGAIYAAVNQLVFGTWLPVSASIKSLGGLGWNTILFEQIARPWREHSFSRALAAVAYSVEGQMLVAFVAALVLAVVARHRSGTPAWRLVVAMAVGSVVFAAKIVLFSGWIVWIWYWFPLVLLLVADLLLALAILSDHAAHRAERLAAMLAIGALIAVGDGGWIGVALLLLGVWWMPSLSSRTRRLATVAAGILLLLAASIVTLTDRPRSDGFVAASRDLAERTRALIGNVPVAMGDRSGAFAYFYGNPVMQLEGLMNDAVFFRRVVERAPILDILCERGVKYVVHYDQDLGAYAAHLVEPFSPVTTTFKGPTIPVAKGDEMGWIDLSRFHPLFGSNPYVYVWRLQCAKS